MKDYYEILEINKKASNEIIENAYKILSKKYKNENADLETINNLNEAYKVLTDVFLRKQYDLELEKENTENKVKSNTPKSVFKRKITSEDKQSVEKPKEKKKHKFIKEDQFRTTKMMYGMTKDTFSFLKEAIINLKNKKMEKEDWTALGLTFIAVIVLGVILWFIPFTNGWMREITVDSPLIKWIFKR